MKRVMNVEIISKETIKPSSPTPLHLRSFKLSLIDQFCPLSYSPLVLFYRPVFGDDDERLVKFSERSQRLKRSLSETLTRYFPLAGRIKDNVSIDCIDQGVDYYEAHVDCPVGDILKQPETDLLKQLVHFDDTSMEAACVVGCLLLVQINLFKCGGIAIGLRFSHKLCDAATFSTFIKAWAVEALKSGEAEAVIPDFSAATLFPPFKDMPISRPVLNSISGDCISKRFLFDASKITHLKAKAASQSVPQPTRVEAVSALIWKCAMNAASLNFGGPSTRLYMLAHAVNLRKRLVPPLPENSVGNITGYIAAQREETIDINLQSLVGQLRKGMADLCGNYARKLRGGNGVSMICESYKKMAEYMMKTEFYTFTSWCRFPLYEADFGWGKPTWVGIPTSAYKNIVLLMDTRDGDGVEAYVSLKQEDMILFEHDPDLLAFGFPNPSVF